MKASLFRARAGWTGTPLLLAASLIACSEPPVGGQEEETQDDGSPSAPLLGSSSSQTDPQASPASPATASPASPAPASPTSTAVVNTALAETAVPSTDSAEAERCDVSLDPGAALVSPGYSVKLTVHVPRSSLSRDSLCAILSEVNEIWWTQAGVCFDAVVVAHDEATGGALDLWFEQAAPFPNGVIANGVYASSNEIYSLDVPTLDAVTQPTRYPASRTAAHELGHAMGLSHQNCVRCDELLMRSGTRGFQLLGGSPADTDEIGAVRATLERALDAPIVTDLGADTACVPALLQAF